MFTFTQVGLAGDFTEGSDFSCGYTAAGSSIFACRSSSSAARQAATTLQQALNTLAGQIPDRPFGGLLATDGVPGPTTASWVAWAWGKIFPLVQKYGSSTLQALAAQARDGVPSSDDTMPSSVTRVMANADALARFFSAALNEIQQLLTVEGPGTIIVTEPAPTLVTKFKPIGAIVIGAAVATLIGYAVVSAKNYV